MTAAYGSENARKVQQRLFELQAVSNLSQVSHQPPPRRHELQGIDKGKFAVDVKQPFRIIFEPAHDPVPYKEDGGIDLERITEICIIEVGNYH